VIKSNEPEEVTGYVILLILIIKGFALLLELISNLVSN